MTRILVVDDEPGVRYTLNAVFKDAGFDVEAVEGGEQALKSVVDSPPDLVITDLQMLPMDGMTLLARLRALQPALPIIMITAHGNEQRAVAAMKAGAWDYLKKPFEVDELLLTVEKTVERLHLRNQNHSLRAQLSLSRPVIHRSEAMARLMSLTHRAATRNVTVLITGETGTGKELIAGALHELSDRRSQPFVAFNMAALPSGTAESELFGHEKGAFTGAHRTHRGLFERAHEGMLFLDEIGDLPLELQGKLLRVLQEGVLLPVGGSQQRKVDVRVVAATHRSLRDEVRAGRFREDLFYRLNVVELHVPALRERREDVAPLVAFFVARHARRLGMEGLGIAPDVVTHLSAREWPGNVRELENAVERLVSLCDGERITPADLEVLQSGGPAGPSSSGALRDRVEAFEASLIREALDRNGGNQSAAARELKISRVTLIDKINKHGLRV